MRVVVMEVVKNEKIVRLGNALYSSNYTHERNEIIMASKPIWNEKQFGNCLPLFMLAPGIINYSSSSNKESFVGCRRAHRGLFPMERGWSNYISLHCYPFTCTASLHTSKSTTNDRIEMLRDRKITLTRFGVHFILARCLTAIWLGD